MSDRTVEWEQHVTPLPDGTELVRLLPTSVVPARARPGMVVLDGATGETGVIVAMTRERCRYETPAGQRVDAAWPSVCLTAVQPEGACVEG